MTRAQPEAGSDLTLTRHRGLATVTLAASDPLPWVVGVVFRVGAGGGLLWLELFPSNN